MNLQISQFFESLSAQERQFLPALVSDDFGLILRSAVNELDWCYYNMSKKEAPTYEEQEQFYLLRLGVTRLIKLALEARPSFDVPTIMFRRNRDMAIATLEMAAGLGMIEHGRRIAQSVSSGLGRIERSAENEFLILLPSAMIDTEYHERVVEEHYQNESRRRIERILQTDIGRKIKADVDEKLSELVFPFATHFIGYDAAPLLDDYFFSIAFGEVQLCDGYDTFHYSIRFGGIQFQKYILALIYFVSISIRHERFAEALVRKDSTVKLENVLTISADTEAFTESIKDAINHFGAVYENFEFASIDEARRIFEIMSCSRKNAALLDRPASPLPLMIQCSDTGFIRCLAGARGNPMQWLLDSLRYHFPSDYDRHQQSRENALQVAIKRVLGEGIDGLEYLENIKLRLNGRLLTDIDLVITERVTGTVLLCQLKYQDLYGSDLHARHIRTSRLKSQVTRWLAALDEWIGAVGEAGIRASLRLPRSFPPLTVYRLVVSKHYGYPLHDLALNADTVYANWAQFFNSVELVKKEALGSQTLSDLVKILKRFIKPNGSQEFLPEPRTEWKIRDLKFTVEQEQT